MERRIPHLPLAIRVTLEGILVLASILLLWAGIVCL